MTENSGKNIESHFFEQFFKSYLHFLEFNFDDFNVFINKTIKEEPLDDEEVPESLPVVVEGFVDPRQHSNLSSVPEIHAKIRRVSSESNQIDEPRINFGASTSAPSRDPRLRNPANVASAVKRQMFLEGSLHADDLIRGTSTKDLDYQPKQIKKIRTHTGDVEKTINSQSTSFHSNLPNVQVLPTGMVENRSPVISNNHNAHFVSFATPDNIKEALKAQRYRNIPRDVQDTAQRVGADLDAISQRMRSRQEETLTSYSSNSRTLSTQTNSRAEATSQASNQSLSVTQNGKTSVEAETQTTKNSGVFSITIDNLSELTNSQRKALEEFKKVRIFCFPRDSIIYDWFHF